MSKPTVTVTGIMYWPMLTRPNPQNDKGQQTFVIGNLSEADVEKIKGLGTKNKPTLKSERVKRALIINGEETWEDLSEEQQQKYLDQDEAEGYSLTLKQASKTKAGKPWPIYFKGTNGKLMDKIDLARLGNGTKIELELSYYETPRGKFITRNEGVVLEPDWYRTREEQMAYESGDDLPPASEGSNDEDDLNDDIPFNLAE